MESVRRPVQPLQLLPLAVLLQDGARRVFNVHASHELVVRSKPLEFIESRSDYQNFIQALL